MGAITTLPPWCNVCATWGCKDVETSLLAHQTSLDINGTIRFETNAYHLPVAAADHLMSTYMVLLTGP